MDSEVEIGENIKEKMDASTSNEDGNLAKELEDELMKFTTSYEGKKFGPHLAEQTEKIHKITDMKVNIVECSTSGGDELVEAEYSDTTECSSSFDDSDYGAEGVDSLGNSEALSDFHGDAESNMDLDGPAKLFRLRKKLSSHWRSFIHPIMWRCKWAELQIKKLEAQAQKYDRRLEEYSRKSTSKGLGIKSLSLHQNDVRSDVLRRKKRRRAEATNDVETYMSHHNLFSYYENRKFIREVAFHVLKNPDASQEVNIDDESWGNDELLCVEAGYEDNILERILRKIEFLHSQVVKMKNRVDKVMSEHAVKFSCTENLSSTVAHDASITSPPNTAASPSTGYRMPMGTYIASQLMSEYNMGGALLSESAVANNEEAVPEVNGKSNRAHFAYAYGNEDDEVLIDNQRVREEMCYLEEVKIHSIQRPLVLKDGLGSTNHPVSAEPNLLMDDQPPPKMHSCSNLTAPLKAQFLPEPDLLMDDTPPQNIHSTSNLANASKSKNKRGRRKGTPR